MSAKRPRKDRRKTVEGKLPKNAEQRAEAIRKGAHCAGRVRLV